MRWSFSWIAFLFLLSPALASAAIFVTGSVNQSSTNMGLQHSEARGGSASVDLGLGSYVRVGLTHQQSFTQAQGWELDEDLEEEDPERYEEFASKQHIIANSIDFTFILYEGRLFVPYIKAGAIFKSYYIERITAAETQRPDPVVNAGPFPNLGMGMGIKLNQQFTLKLFHKASPGFIFDPETNQTLSVWDRQSTVGLSYKL